MLNCPKWSQQRSSSTWGIKRIGPTKARLILKPSRKETLDYPMSFRSTPDITQKSRKTPSSSSMNLSTEHLQNNKSGKAKSNTIKKQNFFADEEEANYMQATLNVDFGPQTESPYANPKLPNLITTPNLTARLATQIGKDDGNLNSDDLSANDEEHLDLSPMPASKLLSTGEKFSPTIPVFKRQDSTPVVMKDFNQIESNLEERFSDSSSPKFAGEKGSPGFGIALGNPSIVPSKFALEGRIKNNSQGGFLFGNKKKIQDFSKVVPFSESGSKTETPGSDERDRKKRWHQLGNAFQSVVMLQREEVRSITDSAAISHEINSFQLRKIVDKPDKVWDISRQDYAREAFQTVRRVQTFCECAAVGSPKHLDMMKELFLKDPKRFMLERDDPAFILNTLNSQGQTPMYIAAKNGNLNVVQFLVENKANPFIESKVSHQEKNKELPIVVAARWGHATIVEYLLKNVDYNEKTLQECIAAAQSQSVKLLLRKTTKKGSMGSDGWKNLVKCFTG